MVEVITEVLLYAALAAVISFAGSLHLGPVNIAVIRACLHRGRRAATFIALGGALPEILYSTIAMASANYLSHDAALWLYFKRATIGVLAIIGLVLLFRRSAMEPQPQQTRRADTDLGLGLLLGVLNPMQLPFWLLIISYLDNFNIVVKSSYTAQISFVIGTSLGGFAALYMLARFTDQKRAYIFERFSHNYNQILGGLLLLVAALQMGLSFMS